MGESTSSGRRILSPGLLFLLLFLLLPSSSLSFDLGSFLSALGGGPKSTECPERCNCSTPRAEEVMQGYVSKYLPYMGLHMKATLEKEARAVIRLMTAWYGSMADIRCRVGQGERVNMSELLQAPGFSFKALRLTCEPGASVLWDVTALSAFLNVLDIKGCGLQAAGDAGVLTVPLNLWVLNMERVPPQDVEKVDLSSALQLIALSVTHSGLTRLPRHWNASVTNQLMYLGFAHNQLTSFSCEVKASGLTSLNLDHNRLPSLPACLLDGSNYASHWSLRHNQLHTLRPLAAIKPTKLHTDKLVQLQPEKSATMMANSSGEAAADRSAKKTVKQPEEPTIPVPYFMHLDVSHNKISSLNALRKIQLLFGLDVSHNRLVSIAADTFSENPALHWLDVSHNALEAVPDGVFSDLAVMEHLNLSHNRLKTFDFDHSPLSTKMVTLDLRYNRLAYPPFADTGYVAPRQSRIAAAHNPFVCDCNMDIFVQFLQAVNNSRQRWFGMGYWDSYENSADVNQPYVDTQELACQQPSDLEGVRLPSLSFSQACPLLRGCPAGCRCQMVKGEKKHASVNCSKTQSLSELPASLPVLPDTPIVLYMNQSGLKRLDHRPYLRQVRELHAANSKVSVVTPGAMQALQNVTVLDLHNNQLRSLPPVTQNLSLHGATNISLGGNPWTCGCHDLWMPDWLSQHSSVVFSPADMRCRWTGKEVAELSEDDLNCGVFNYLPLVIALSMLLGLAAVVASLLVKYRLEVLVFLYTRFRVRPFDLYKYDKDKPYLYDIFVSFSQHDYRWVVEKLVDQLENRSRPYRLCIHLRDFPVGAPIADSVAWAVENSRCTLLVLTRDFLGSEWCRHEFRAAHARLLKDPTAKLLIVVHGPLDARILDRELLAYLRTHTYLRTEDKWFWAKLEYALPDPQEGVVMMMGAAPQDGQAGGPPDIDMDTFLPAAMAAGDIPPKPNAQPSLAEPMAV